MPTCKLCRNEVRCFVNSHIIPESFYETLGKSGKAGVILDVEGHSVRSPIGIYGQFLCHDCEQKFKEWDDYACRLLRDTPPDETHAPSVSKFPYYVYQQVNYELLKLFFISVVWRAHACPTHTPIFGDIRLPEVFAEQLRQAIQGRAAPPAEVLPVFVGKSDQPIAYAVAPPKAFSIAGADFIKVYMPGYVFLVQIEEGQIPQPLFLFLLHPGTGLTAWYHDYVACGEADEAAIVYFADRNRPRNKASRNQ